MFSSEVPNNFLESSFFQNELYLIQINIFAGIKFRLSELKVKNTGVNYTGEKVLQTTLYQVHSGLCPRIPFHRNAGWKCPQDDIKVAPQRVIELLLQYLNRMPDQGKGVSYQWQPSRPGYWHGSFYHGSHGQQKQDKKHLSYPEVDTEGVPELNYLKGRELKRKGISWKPTMMPFKEKTK